MSAIRFSKAAPIAATAARFRAAHGLAADELLITVLPGSRGGEVRRLLPIFGAALSS